LFFSSYDSLSKSIYDFAASLAAPNILIVLARNESNENAAKSKNKPSKKLKVSGFTFDSRANFNLPISSLCYS